MADEYGQTRPVDSVCRRDGSVIYPDDAYEVTAEGQIGLGVFVQDQTTPPLDLFFLQSLGPPTQLALATAIDDLTATVVSDAVFTAGDYVGIFSSTQGRFYFAELLDATANVLTFDTPLDFAFSVGDNVLPATRDLNVDGSSTSSVFQIQGGGTGSGITVDITRILLEITTDSLPAFDAFGNIAGGLVNGLVLRRVDGTTRNIWNIKKNSEFANLAYDYTLLSGFGAAVDGLLVRYTFAGQDKHGVAVRLAPGDSLQLLIQDDLTDLLSFRVIAAGHIVQ